jgi:hypothetical protein
MPNPRLDPIFHPGDGTVVLRIRGDDQVETTIEWGWEKVLDLGSSLIEHAPAGPARPCHASPHTGEGCPRAVPSLMESTKGGPEDRPLVQEGTVQSYYASLAFGSTGIKSLGASALGPPSRLSAISSRSRSRGATRHGGGYLERFRAFTTGPPRPMHLRGRSK